MEDKPEIFETKPIARSNVAGSLERTEQEVDSVESSVQVLEDAALQMLALSSALLGAFLGLLMFSDLPPRVPDEARLIIGIAFGFLFWRCSLPWWLSYLGRGILPLLVPMLPFAFRNLCGANIALVVWPPGALCLPPSSC